MAAVMPRFEVCVESAGGVLAALAAGADRIELCADLAVGGITPSAGLIQWAVAAVSRDPAVSPPGRRMAVHVLVRPRGGDFVYTAAEADVIARDILIAKASGADGIVLGALTASGAVDVALTSRLVALARPLSITFHRAFDETADPAASFDDVLALGVDRLLTSGAAATALEGADLIASLARRCAGRVEVMAGSGVTEQTAAEILRRTGVRELHFSARASAPELPLADRITRIMAAAGSER